LEQGTLAHDGRRLDADGGVREWISPNNMVQPGDAFVTKMLRIRL
jgi:hypothetical protein